MTTYQLNEAKSGVEIYFEDKPNEETRNLLKANNFRWGKTNKCWYAKQSDQTILIAQQLSENQVLNVETEISTSSYPEIEIDDCNTYTIDQQIQDKEHDSAWVFRKGKRNHDDEIQQLFEHYTNKIKDTLTKTDNEYYIFKLKTKLQQFKKQYHTLFIKYLTHKGNNPSWAVTGRGGLNVTRYNKQLNRQDSMMLQLAELPKELEEFIAKYENKIRKDKKNAVKEKVDNTVVNVTFTASTQEFEYMGYQEKKRVYSYGAYSICKLWASFKIFKDGKEIHSMRTIDKLEDAKKYVCMLLENEKNLSA